MKEKLSLNRNGLSLYGLLEGPDPLPGEMVPVAILMHGYNTSSRQHPFYDLTRELWKQGIATIRFDFSSHGRSDGDITQMSVDDLIQDAEIFYSYAKQLVFTDRIYLIGFSLGAVIASHLAVNHQEDVPKLALLSPGADIRDRAKAGFFFGHIYDPEDPPEVLETEMGRIGRPYFLSAQKLEIFEHMKEYNGEVLIVYGEKDEFVPLENTLHYRTVIRNLTMCPVSEAGHMWEVNSDQAVQAITGFLASDQSV